jgi:hypothetical protein
MLAQKSGLNAISVALTYMIHVAMPLGVLLGTVAIAAVARPNLIPVVLSDPILLITPFL